MTMAEVMPHGDTLYLSDWLLPWRALRVIRFYASALAIAHSKAHVMTTQIAILTAACKAAVRYDESICGAAARGEVDLRENGGGVSTGDELDALYEDWMEKARAALAMTQICGVSAPEIVNTRATSND